MGTFDLGQTRPVSNVTTSSVRNMYDGPVDSLDRAFRTTILASEMRNAKASRYFDEMYSTRWSLQQNKGQLGGGETLAATTEDKESWFSRSRANEDG